MLFRTTKYKMRQTWIFSVYDKPYWFCQCAQEEILGNILDVPLFRRKKDIVTLELELLVIVCSNVKLKIYKQQ